MTLLRFARVWLVIALAGLAVGVTATGVAARPRRAPPPAPAPPPPMPDVGMARSFIDAAAAYEDYMRQAQAISPAFADATGVQASLRAGAAYEPAQFVRGEIAYAAIAALQDPTFVAAVRAAGQTPQERYAIVASLFANTANALAFGGAANAAGLAKDALDGDGLRLFDAGRAVTLAAYTMQHQPWSLQPVAGRDERLAAVKALSRTPRTPGADAAAELQRASDGQASLGLAEDPARAPYSPLIIRAVALAALAAIGQAGDQQAANLAWLTDDYFTDHCLAQAKIELNGCLSVAGPNYEDVFCLGEHALNDTGACVVQGAGDAIPLDIATRPLYVPPYHHRYRPRRRYVRRRRRR